MRRQIIAVWAAAIAYGCSNSDDVTEPSSTSVGSVEITFARDPARIGYRDTITVIAAVRDTRGNLLPDTPLYWDIRPAPGYNGYTNPVGSLRVTGARTAVISLDVTKGVVVAGAQGIFTEIIVRCDTCPADIPDGFGVQQGR